jgi:hypothetical protein
MKAQEEYLPWDQLQNSLMTIRELIESRDAQSLIPMMQSLVEQYQPTHDLVDWAHLKSTGKSFDATNIE